MKESLIAEMHSINARVAGMTADNNARMFANLSPSYGDGDFAQAETELLEIAIKLRKL